MRLVKGRTGLPINIGIKTYKALVRIHLEYGIAGWGYKAFKMIGDFQKVQGQALKKICGAFSSSSNDAIEVVAGVIPIDIRLKELCRREAVKILALKANHPLRELSELSSKSNNICSPMKFLNHSCRNLWRWMQNEKVEIELQSEITPDIILKARRTKIIKIFDVKVGNSKSRSEEQKKNAWIRSRNLCRRTRISF